jgi:hypothetical protein
MAFLCVASCRDAAAALPNAAGDSEKPEGSMVCKSKTYNE